MEIDRLLIANRGEIACRVIRTARRLGIRTIAVYSEADEHALHVRMADAAYPIGPSPAAESYLDAGKILDVAERSRAAAIHPGYGFLSENAEFAEACEARGIAFVGPTPDAIRSMAEKDVAKRLMREAGVPVIPGEEGDEEDPQAWIERADAVGFPLLIKAVAGGGGRGMRVVASAGEFAEAFESARREARASFGEDRILIERLLDPSRHVEVQVFGDAHGNALHLFERDCSIQRRHQKVVEEAPAPGLSPELRAEMGAAAVRAAKAIGYRGAGTVEFLLDVSAAPDSGSFHFMEMNTRLQVEHPVTEMVTGIDLVEWQLRIAAGEPLPCTQSEIELRGHAIETRIYAENPRKKFLPATGRILHLGQPEPGEGVRVETGYETGDAVTPFYDAMLAKLVVWGEDREHAVGRLSAALADYQLAGISTNRDLLARIAADAAFQVGGVDSRYLEAALPELLDGKTTPREQVVAVAVLDSLLARGCRPGDQARESVDPDSPWSLADGWRLNGLPGESMSFVLGGEELPVEIEGRSAGCWSLRFADQEIMASGQTVAWSHGAARDVGVHRFECTLDGERHLALVVSRGEKVEIFFAGETFAIVHRDLQADSGSEEEGAGAVRTPMPGKVTGVLVAEGDRVKKGQPLVVLEAMKMEHTIRAGLSAVVETLSVTEGDQVEDDATLLILKAR